VALLPGTVPSLASLPGRRLGVALLPGRAPWVASLPGRGTASLPGSAPSLVSLPGWGLVVVASVLAGEGAGVSLPGRGRRAIACSKTA
jgi:hypothetical protein